MFCEGTIEPEWVQADRNLKALAKERAMHDFEEARCLLAAVKTRVHENLGYASCCEYLHRLFGYGPRLANEKIRVAQALERLPEMAISLRDAVLNWSAVRVLSRIAIAETESEWIETAKTKSVHELEQFVSGRKRGDRPTDPANPKLEEHVFLFRVLPETAAVLREAMMKVKRDAGSPLTEDETIRTIARTVLEGPADEGRASYQIVLTRCDDCGRTRQRGCGEEIDVAPHVLEMAECDAQRLDIRDPSDTVPHAKQDTPPATRRFVTHRDHGKCVVPGCKNAIFLDIHHLHLRSEGGDHRPDLLATMCTAHHAQVHEGRLLIEGTASTGLVFRHADGSSYGANVDPKIAAALSDAFDGLLALGFKQSDAKHALDHVRTQQPPIDNGAAALRLALRYLHRP